MRFSINKDRAGEGLGESFIKQIQAGVGTAEVLVKLPYANRWLGGRRTLHTQAKVNTSRSTLPVRGAALPSSLSLSGNFTN